jgi:hypothetical protein
MEPMQTIFSDDGKHRNVLSSGLGMVASNKRYIFWFWLLSLVLAWSGTTSLRESAHSILDHSLYAGRLLHGFDLSVYIEMLLRPEFGTTPAHVSPAVYFAASFFLLTALFLPGVFLGFSSPYRLPREDFFRACGRNLWRFIRLMIIAGIVMGIVAAILFGLNAAIVKKAGDSTNELLPFETQMVGLVIIFLIMTTLRIWFDLAEADIVLNDQRAVCKSIAAGFRHTFHSLGRLLSTYVVATIVAAIILIGGLWIWKRFVAPENIVGAFVVVQVTLLLLLIPRFWQRGIAVSYWQQRMLAPVAVTPPVVPTPAPEASQTTSPSAPAASAAPPPIHEEPAGS